MKVFAGWQHGEKLFWANLGAEFRKDGLAVLAFSKLAVYGHKHSRACCVTLTPCGEQAISITTVQVQGRTMIKDR